VPGAPDDDSTNNGQHVRTIDLAGDDSLYKAALGQGYYYSNTLYTTRYTYILRRTAQDD